jgi:hypothetical protein
MTHRQEIVMPMMIALAIALTGSLESPCFPQDIIVPATQQASELVDFMQSRVFLRYQFPDGRRIDLDSNKWDSCNLWTGNPLTTGKCWCCVLVRSHGIRYWIVLDRSPDDIRPGMRLEFHREPNVYRCTVGPPIEGGNVLVLDPELQIDPLKFIRKP